jgi:hypothetical protein
MTSELEKKIKGAKILIIFINIVKKKAEKQFSCKAGDSAGLLSLSLLMRTRINLNNHIMDIYYWVFVRVVCSCFLKYILFKNILK